MKLLAALVMIISIPVFAGMVEYGVHGGLLFPSGDLSDGFKTSYIIGGNILAHMPMFAIEGSIGYGILQTKLDQDDFSASLIPIIAGIRTYSGPIFYGGGGGVYISSVSYTDPVAGDVSDSDSKFGIYGNVGMILPAGTMDLEGSLKYHLVDFDTDKAWLALTVGTYF